MEKVTTNKINENKTKVLLRNFIKEKTHLIITKRAKSDVKTLKSDANLLLAELKKTGNRNEDALQHLEDTLRYLAFFLADSSRHNMAMETGVFLNDVRNKYTSLLKGLKFNRAAFVNRLSGFVMGYGFKPLRVVRATVIVWIFFALAIYSISFFSESPSLILKEGEPIEWFHYLYFSGVTLTTLDYGDISPNPQHNQMINSYIVVCN